MSDIYIKTSSESIFNRAFRFKSKCFQNTSMKIKEVLLPSEWRVMKNVG